MMNRLCGHDWPGNVRELKNAVERAAILACHGAWQMSALANLEAASARAGMDTEGLSSPPRVAVGAHGPDGSVVGSDCIEEVERRHILAVLEATNWVLGGPRGAAIRLGVKRPTLIYRMKKLGIDRSALEPPKCNREAVSATDQSFDAAASVSRMVAPQ